MTGVGLQNERTLLYAVQGLNNVTGYSIRNVQTIRQEAGALISEGERLLAVGSTRARTQIENNRMNWITNRVEELLAEAKEEERKEGFTGVSKPMGGSTRNSGMFSNGRGTGEGYTATDDTTDAIYCRVLRTGDPGAISELRASNATDMNITTAADGGNLVPVGHYNRIIEKARETALWPLLGVRMIPGKGTTVNVPIDNEADNGAFVATAESALWDLDAPAVAQIPMTLVKYTKRVVLTYELLQDEDSGLLDYLNHYVGAGYAATVNTLLITEALAGGTAALTFDSATGVGASEIPELLYSLGAAYANSPNVAWVMNRATEGELRSIQGDSFVFAPTATGRPGARAELFGIPVYSSVDMPATAAGNKSIILGSWGYMGMRLDPQLEFLRDPFTRSSYGETILNYYFRCDLAVFQPLAFVYGTHPAS